MSTGEKSHWLRQGGRHFQSLHHLTQPMTTQQLARHLGISADTCNQVMVQLRTYKCIECLNPEARRSRLYGLTKSGRQYRYCLQREQGRESLPYYSPDLDWSLYGWICFSHRSTVLKTMSGPMQAASIKRQAYKNDPNITMSANNARDVLWDFREKGLVRRVDIAGKVHPRYELTPLGKEMQNLLFRAEDNSAF